MSDSNLFAALTALHHLIKGFFTGLLEQCSQVLYLNFLYLLIVAQTFSQHCGPRPQHQPAGLNGTIALQRLPPIFQQGADVQSQILGGAP